MDISDPPSPDPAEYGADPDEAVEAAEANPVRPYTLTAGRTRSSVDLPLEAPVHTLEAALAQHWPAADPRGRIVKLCVANPSVAEVSARLDIPLGVARVLVGDLVASGYLEVRRTLDEDSSRDERRDLIGRTLRGLRALR